MKHLLRFSILLIVFSAIALVGAQDDVETTTPELSGVFVQIADSGAFDVLEDDSFSLTLNGIADYTAWQFISPELDGGRMATNLIALYWLSMPNLTTTALLETEDVTLELVLAQPDFNTETGVMTFNVQVTEMYYTAIDADLKDDVAVPETFDAATLFIVLDQPFIDDFNVGADLANVRGPNTSKNCSNPSNGRCNNVGFDTFNVR